MQQSNDITHSLDHTLFVRFAEVGDDVKIPDYMSAIGHPTPQHQPARVENGNEESRPATIAEEPAQLLNAESGAIKRSSATPKNTSSPRPVPITLHSPTTQISLNAMPNLKTVPEIDPIRYDAVGNQERPIFSQMMENSNDLETMPAGVDCQTFATSQIQKQTSQVHQQVGAELNQQADGIFQPMEPKVHPPLPPFEQRSSPSPTRNKQTPKHDEPRVKSVPKFAPRPDDPEIRLTKQRLLAQLQLLKRKNGIVLSREFSMQDTLEEIKWEYEIHKTELEVSEKVVMMKQGMYFFFAFVEHMNERYLNSLMKLSGMTASIQKDPKCFDQVLEKIYYRFCKKGASANPFVELGFMVFVIIISFHFANKTQSTVNNNNPQAGGGLMGGLMGIVNLMRNGGGGGGAVGGGLGGVMGLLNRNQQAAANLPPRAVPVQNNVGAGAVAQGNAAAIGNAAAVAAPPTPASNANTGTPLAPRNRRRQPIPDIDE